MGGEITLTYSTTDATGHYNSSEQITNLTTFEYTSKWTNAEVARFLHIIVRAILLSFGTLGNCSTIYIMRRSSLKHLSSCFYMFILALADTSKLWIYLLIIQVQDYNSNSKPQLKQDKDCIILKNILK